MNDLLDKITSKSPHLSWLNNNTVYLTLHGSKAYGTNVEASDDDYKGICIPTKEYFLGSQHRFEQAELHEPDMVIYDIRKFFNLAAASNPNIVEALYTDPSDHILVDPIGEIILDNRDKFLSKRVKHTFSGYAVSQLKRIKLHRRYLLNPPKVYPTRVAFGLPEHTLIPQDHLLAAEAEIRKELERYNFDYMDECSEAMKISIRNTMSEMLAEMKLNADDQWRGAARKIGVDDNFIELMQMERAYKNARTEWDNYENWKKNRNPKRAADEAKWGYDCYVEETEFLTDSGWKTFDQISNKDKLGTVYLGNSKFRDYLGVEYQNYTEKFDGTFNGNLYNLIGFHTDVMITPNHKMLIQEVGANTNTTKNWDLVEIANIPHTFNILGQISPKKRNYTDSSVFDFAQTGIPDVAFLRLMGWYLSDGSMAFKKETPYAVIISQIKTDSNGKPGKLYSSMKKFANKYSCSFHEHNRMPSQKNPRIHIEAKLSVRGIIPKIINRDCGNLQNKRIPRWVFSLSKRKMEVLLDALIRGDGTVFRPDNSIIYYSSLKDLADDVQELAFLCGFETSLYGPYKSIQYRSNGEEYELSMFHVHINKTRDQIRKLGRRSIRKILVENKRIVCFSVPNSVLITRYNGHIAMHGNSKHAYHLIRLLRMAREILETGKVLVKRPDREELLAIRNGAWSYEQIVEFAEKEDKALQEIYMTSTILPKVPDQKYIDNLCIQLVEKSLSRYSWYNVKKYLKGIL